MKTIYKYPVEMEDSQVIQLPAGAEILCVQAQNGLPCLWALVDPNTTDTETENRTFIMRGTGHPIFEGRGDLTYIGTFQMKGGHLVFHLFEKATP